MESVIEFDLQEEPIGEILSNGQFNGRFETTTSELNTLAMQQLLRVHETNQGPEYVALEKRWSMQMELGNRLLPGPCLHS